MKGLLLLIVSALVTGVFCRDGRWFLPQRTVTSVAIQRRLVTENVPSSCVVLEPSIPPCRNLRRIGINPTPPTKMFATPDPRGGLMAGRIVNVEPSHDDIQRVSEGQKGWGWWGGVTITKTLAREVTLRKVDPQTVVTFSVRGCQPTRLPFDLPLCSAAVEQGPPGVSEGRDDLLEERDSKTSVSRELHYSPVDD